MVLYTSLFSFSIFLSFLLDWNCGVYVCVYFAFLRERKKAKLCGQAGGEDLGEIKERKLYYQKILYENKRFKRQ